MVDHRKEEWLKLFKEVAPVTLQIPKSSWGCFPEASQLHPNWLRQTSSGWIFEFEQHWLATQKRKITELNHCSFNWHRMQTRRATQMKTTFSNFFDQFNAHASWLNYNPLGQMEIFTKEQPICQTVIMYIYALNVWMETFIVFLKKNQILESQNGGQRDDCFTQLDEKIVQLGAHICNMGLDLHNNTVSNSGEHQISKLVRLSNVSGYLLHLLLTH